MSKKFLIVMVFFLIPFFLPQPSLAAANLIKGPNSSAVYYVDENNIRHIFPNEKTFESWLGNNFSSVVTVSEEYLGTLPLGKNVTIKPGKYLVKVPSIPKVYAVEPGGTLRHLESATIAEKIYGFDWFKKIIDLPEVFFGDYAVGEPMRSVYEVPDGVIYKFVNKDNYYYKVHGYVRKFASWQDVLANGYNQNDIISGNTTFLLHGKEIKGYDESVSNLSAESNLANYDCENKNLRGAFIFVYNNQYRTDQLDKITAIKKDLASYFSWATDNLSNMEVADEIFKVKKENYHILEDKLDVRQVAYDFYAQNKDVYDFLFVFDNFSPESKTVAEYSPATNQISGIQKTTLKSEMQFGSKGKLKGAVKMFNINSYNFTEAGDKERALNTIVHEMLHQWSGSLIFSNNKNEDDASLLEKDRIHWSKYVSFVSPLGGYGWQDNGNGTFTQSDISSKIKFSNLDLYTLGLMPLRGIGEIFYLVPNNDFISDTISAKKVIVNPEKLVQAMGEWRCLAK